MASAADSQRGYRRGRPHTYTGHSSGRAGGKEHFPPHPMSSSTSPSNLPGVYSNPDMAYALVAIVGCLVDVQMQSGVIYRGVLRAVSPQLSVALALANDTSKEPSAKNTEKLMQLEFADIVTVTVQVDTGLSQTNIFKTDTEISRTNGSGGSKELQPFAFDDEGTGMVLADQSGGWSAEDMFETNRSKFNVESSYNEEMTEYTTKLNRTDTKDFRAREQRAERLAREIESMDKQEISDIGTEEELFSAVVRQDVAPPPPSVPKPRHIPSNSTSQLSVRPPPATTGSNTRMVSEGRSYSAVAETAIESRPPGRGGSDHANSSQSQQGTNSSLSGSSSQECHMVPATDVDGMNPRGGWTSQEGLSLSGENAYLEKEPLSTALEEGSQESLEQAAMEEEEEGKVDEDRLQDTVQAPTEVVSEVQNKEGTSEEAAEPAAVPVSKTSDLAEREEKVRKFQLDPNAKSFSLNVGAKEFVPSSFTPPSNSSPLAQSASSPSVLESSDYHTPPHDSTTTGKKYPKRQHNHTSSTTSSQYVPQEMLQSYISPTGSFVYSPAPPSLVRNTVPNQQIQYSSNVPFTPPYLSSAGAFVPPSQALVSPQHMVSNGQKFDINPVYAGNQYSMVPMGPHQLMQQQQGQLLAPVSQQLPSASGALVTTPPSGNPPLMMVQGGAQGPMGAMYQQVMGQNRFMPLN